MDEVLRRERCERGGMRWGDCGVQVDGCDGALAVSASFYPEARSSVRGRVLVGLKTRLEGD